jgi:hypothetical protein
VVDGASVGAVPSHTFTMVTDDHTIAASFAYREIEFAPASVQFGDVTVGTSTTQIVTISNSPTANVDLTVSGISLAPGSNGFAITSAPTVPFVLSPGVTADVVVTFAPSAAGPFSGTLRIASNDPDEGLVEVALSGNGVPAEIPPSQQITNILTFFDQSVANGTLVGNGPGNSAQGRLKALKNMIEAAGDLISHGRVQEARQQLQDAYLRVDGQPKPPEFAAGPAAAQLASMIQQLINSLGG